MTLRWLICFNASLLSLCAAPVSGRVELRDSRFAAVRTRHDFSGVVIALTSADTTAMPAADKRAVMLQKDKTFTPHVLAVQAGSLVEFPNADPIFHNAFSSYNGQVFDIGLYPPGTTRSVKFARPGVVRVFCNIHAQMSALIVVVASPYFATTKQDGNFSIADVPAGQYNLNVFHERASEATLAALSRKITLGPDGASLSNIVISEAGYLSIPHKNKYGHDYPADSGDLAYPGSKP
jgi:plastocyanin